VADPLTELAPPKASTGNVMVPPKVPWTSETANGTVTSPPLISPSEPLELKVPVSVPTPVTVSVAGPETDMLVCDDVMEAFVTVNVKFSVAAAATTIRMDAGTIRELLMRDTERLHSSNTEPSVRLNAHFTHFKLWDLAHRASGGGNHWLSLKSSLELPLAKIYKRWRPYFSWLDTQSDDEIAAPSETSPASTTPATISPKRFTLPLP